MSATAKAPYIATPGLRPKHLALRERRHAECAVVHRRALDAANINAGELAAVLGTKRQRVQEMGDVHSTTSPSVVQVAMGPREWSEALVRWQGSMLRLQVLPEVEDEHGGNHIARLAAVTIECSDPARVLASALADNDLSDAELEVLAREFREAAMAALEGEAAFVCELKRRRDERNRR